MPKWAHIAFCVIWLGTAAVFGFLAFDSYKALDTELTRFPQIPNSGGLLILGVDIIPVLRSVSTINNQNATALETSIRSSARLGLTLNIFSFAMAMLGFAAQVSAYRYERRRDQEKRRDNEASEKPPLIREHTEFTQGAAEKDQSNSP